MLPTAMEAIAFNQNRKNSDIKFFEFGKTYQTTEAGSYQETNHLCLYVSGNSTQNHWKGKGKESDFYFLKGVVESILCLAELQPVFSAEEDNDFDLFVKASVEDEVLVKLGNVAAKTASKFDVKQAVYFANFNWDVLAKRASENKIQYKEITKYPTVERDLALVVPKTMKYDEITKEVTNLHLARLREVKLFDIFENEKLGKEKKSMAINFTFLDEEKTLTDKEIDGWMNKIMNTLEKELGAEIRK
jgi:phenylalanyl-tRNA synthetase beta chain